MVTEPDFGSDVAGVKVTATPTDGGYLLNGVKTWCTFAGRADTLMVLARTDPDRSLGHRGLSVLRRRQAAGARPPLRVRRRPRREDGRPGDRHARLPRHALLRGRVRQLVRARRQPHRARRRPRQGLLPADGGLRERAAADRGPGRRRSCRPRSTPGSRTRRSARCSASRSSTTSSRRRSSPAWPR